MSRGAFVLGLALLLAGCARHYTGVPEPYGFFYGFWHGLILPFSVIGYFVMDGVYIIGQPNTGWSYFTGFGIGVLTLMSSAN